MEAPFWRFGLFALALLFGACGLVAAYLRSSRRARHPDKKRSLIDYLLVWPLLLSNDKKSTDIAEGAPGLFTSRAAIGWLLVLILIVLAMVFRW